MNIGICGAGFVGGTCYKVFSQLNEANVKMYDKDPAKSKNTIEEVAGCDFVFLAVPTPMNLKTGECYTGIVEKAIAELRKHSKDCVIVIKSTVPPTTTEKLNFSYGRILFSPEFLTEASPYEDFCNLGYQIIGVPELESTKHADELANVFYEAHLQGVINSPKVYTVHSRLAELTKYVRNTYLATRLSFFNEIKQIADELQVPYETLSFYAGLDRRVGQHYNRIDEDEPEYSGSCLPKDVNALREIAKKLKIKPTMLEATWNKNLEIAKKKTWENLPGRAFIEE